ncbi:competence protein CoiA family protein [Alkalihalobacterium elongatum]|uniref:competence protein CoiA family protein n=1 Tax=Alkalihalobacterium elongatum TaxID=2675466 RepID=UPI001C1F3F11|nr:competence protein CoiA family protein [Alkalihalobacterium elongatum]
MPRYAYIPFNDTYKTKLYNLETDEFRGKKVFKVDSTTLSDEELSLIKNSFKESFYCFSCDSKMKFRKLTNRHNHFAHISRKDCFEAESLAHSSVKKDLYERFRKRGYEVSVERVFRSNQKQVRTDVAVIKKSDVLAIEVQASASIKRSTIAERTNTYSENGIPTAWVLVLDSFFGEGNFTSTKEEILVKNEDGTSRYEEKLLPYSKATPFVITVDTPKSFNFLLEIYKYIIAVNHEGHFFVIRRTDVTGNTLEIFRMEQDKVVDSLLNTEIKTIDYTSQKREDKKPIYELQHTEGIHSDETEYEGEKVLRGYNIDFNQAFEEEQEQIKNDKPIDIIQVIEETKKREKLYAKKKLILDSLNQELLNLNDENLAICSIYSHLEESLKRQFKDIENKYRKKIEKSQLDKDQEKLRLLEQQRKNEVEKGDNLKKGKSNNYTEKNNRVKSLLLNEVKKKFEKKSLNQLIPYVSKYSPYIRESLFNYMIEQLEKSVKEISNEVFDIYEIQAVEMGVILKSVIQGKNETQRTDHTLSTKDEVVYDNSNHKLNEEQLIHENKQKDKLCKEIEEMQNNTGISIVKSIEELRKRKLKEIREIHRNVSMQYERLTQLSLF